MRIGAMLFATFLVGLAGPPLADTLLLQGEDTSQQPMQMSMVPSRGMTMERVESAYGQPRVRHRAVGDPPITRWEYDGFVVYFEYSRVIHTVMKRPGGSARTNLKVQART